MRNEFLDLRYLEVAEALRQKIIGGVYNSGQRLPRQHDLARELGVAFGTLKKALDILGNEGYLIRKAGRGTYATFPERNTPVALVVDDDEGIRYIFAKSLPECGWECVTAESGSKALEMF